MGKQEICYKTKLTVDITHEEFMNYDLQVFNKYADVFGFTPRKNYSFVNPLKQAGIKTVRDLIEYTPTQLLELEIMGRSKLKMVEDTLRFFGYSLKQE